MKILFTADVHIKLGQKNVPVQWAKDRYYQMIDKLATLSKSCDLFVIGGDVFDRMPTMEELEIYYDLVSSFNTRTLIYPGNHESVKRDTSFLSYLKRSTNRLNARAEIVDDFYTDHSGLFDIIPYNKLKQYNPADIDFHSPILFTHVRGEIPPHVKPEVDLSIFDRWQVVLAGDLHSYDNCQRNILYPGSPVTTSFHRNPVDTGVILFDTSTMDHEWIKLDLPQLIRKTIKAGEPMAATHPHHTIYEIEGDMSELGEVADSELIDKKIVKRDTDTALILDPKMSLQEELKEYLTYILQLSEPAVEQAIQILNNNMDKISD